MSGWRQGLDSALRAGLRTAQASSLGRVAAVLLLAAGLGACSTVVKVAEPLNCDASAELLARRCDLPRPLADGATYEQVLQAGGHDRDALRVCARQVQLLADVVRACNSAIDRHREAIRAINNAPR